MTRGNHNPVYLLFTLKRGARYAIGQVVAEDCHNSASYVPGTPPSRGP